VPVQAFIDQKNIAIGTPRDLRSIATGDSIEKASTHV